MASSKRNPYPRSAQVLLLTLKSSIFLVPGTGTTSPEDWPFANPEWLTTLPGSGAGARILAYKYVSPFAGIKPSWESILMLGYDFLQHLSDARLQSNSDLVSEVVLIHALRAVGMLADAPFLDHQQANRDSLP